MMPESSDISYDTDILYTLADSLAESQAVVRAQFSGAGINENPQYNSDDYGREIIKYIAMPKNNGNNIEFDFSIGSIKAKEKKWIGPALLIKALTDRVDIEYSIISKLHIFCIGTLIDYFCIGMLVGSPVHFVLNLFEEQDRAFCMGIIINAGSIDFQNFSPKYFF